MNGILLIAHGSRRSESNEEVQHLTDTLRTRLGGKAIIVCCAFLEQASPSIPEGIDECIQAGARDILILPYFLSAGRHVSRDIPALIQQKQIQYPEISFHLRPHIGSSEAMTDLLLAMINPDTK